MIQPPQKVNTGNESNTNNIVQNAPSDGLVPASAANHEI